RLKAALNRSPLAAGYGTIPRGRMEGADPLDLTDLVIGFYREGYGARVVGEALRGAKGLCQRVLPGFGSAKGRAKGLCQELAAPRVVPKGCRFVARHRLALIGRVRGVAALLDRLQADGVLTAEEAAAVAAGPTPQEQMRRLLATAPAWGRRGHRRFLRAVRCLHPHLMEDLEGS
uniref:CARD domain-containing protein n=1 Tax=Accipiter nisus TaxID=211598 RepID=A0A8B9NIP8_9AVES